MIAIRRLGFRDLWYISQMNSNVMYVSINQELIKFQNYLGVLSRVFCGSG